MTSTINDNQGAAMSDDDTFDFGVPAHTYVPREFDPEDIWIKRFLPGETSIHFVDKITNSVMFQQHFDNTVKRSFPCKQNPTCVGCNHGNPEVRKTTRMYAFNAVDEHGQVQVFKFGGGLYEKFERNEQQKKLLDRWYTVIRTGSNLLTKYDREPGDIGEVDVDLSDLHDIKPLLSKQYREYVALNEGNDDNDTVDRAHKAPVTELRKANQPKDAFSGDIEGNVDDWPISKLKAYCDEHNIDIPTKVSHATLVGIVTAHGDKPPY